MKYRALYNGHPLSPWVKTMKKLFGYMEENHPEFFNWEVEFK